MVAAAWTSGRLRTTRTVTTRSSARSPAPTTDSSRGSGPCGWGRWSEMTSRSVRRLACALGLLLVLATAPTPGLARDSCCGCLDPLEDFKGYPGSVCWTDDEGADVGY